MNADQIIREVREEMNASLVSPRKWYVGVSRNGRNNLFQRHHVHEAGDRWIHLPPCNSSDAERVLSYFRKSLFWHADVGQMNGAGNQAEIYAFRKEPHTDP